MVGNATGGAVWYDAVLTANGTTVSQQAFYSESQYGGGIDNKTFFSYLDTATSAVAGTPITYRVLMGALNNASGSLQINWWSGHPATSFMTLMEIAQ
jgi:hypothetical protein